MMSATLDQDKFAAYFSDVAIAMVSANGGGGDGKGGGGGGKGSRSGGGGSMGGGTGGGLCPVLSIPGFAHPVEDFFLEDVAALTGVTPRNIASARARAANGAASEASSGNAAAVAAGATSEREEDDGEEDDFDEVEDEENDEDDAEDGGNGNKRSPDGGGGGGGARAAASWVRSGGVAKAGGGKGKGFELGGAVDAKVACDMGLLARAVRAVVAQGKHGPGGSILVFLPGVGEITRLCQDLSCGGGGGGGLHVLPLHGALPASEQARVFGPPPKGLVKVVAATNVAENSITIPDCTVVIDCCRVKQVRAASLFFCRLSLLVSPLEEFEHVVHTLLPFFCLPVAPRPPSLLSCRRVWTQRARRRSSPSAGRPGTPFSSGEAARAASGPESATSS